jgi:hypothetical protein
MPTMNPLHADLTDAHDRWIGVSTVEHHIYVLFDDLDVSPRVGRALTPRQSRKLRRALKAAEKEALSSRSEANKATP